MWEFTTNQTKHKPDRRPIPEGTSFLSRCRCRLAGQAGCWNGKEVSEVTLQDGREDTGTKGLILVQSRSYGRRENLRLWQSSRPLLLDREKSRVRHHEVKALLAILTLPLVLGLSGCGESHEGDSPRKKAAT